MSPIAYAPPYAVEGGRAVLMAFIKDRGFATFVSVLDGRPALAHAPVVAVEGALRFHLAKGNPFLAAARAGAAAIAAFQGPDAYVSPDWYVSENQVPTWNYQVVYAQGPLRPLSRDELIAQVDALSAEQEERLAPKTPWTRAKMAPGSDLRLLAGIEGVELRLDRLEGKFKLSQNKSAADRASAAAALEAQGLPGGRAIAAAMRRATPED